MTNWIPNLSQHDGPRYRAIADAIAADIDSGALSPGARLPTHRDLAYRLQVTIGTVSRAYTEAERRGLIGGEVGRGTFVRTRADAAASIHPLIPDEDLIEFSVNVPSTGTEAKILASTLQTLATSPNLQGLLGYQPYCGLKQHRAAMTRMLENLGIPAASDRMLLTSGAQHAVSLAFHATAHPGDTVLTEQLTYAGVKRAATMAHLKLKGLPLDEDGIRPDGFEAACREGGVRALYCVPTLHNPTGITWSLERRRAIVEIAQRHNVFIIEDDVYGFLVPNPPPSLLSLAPDHVFYLNSTSKNLAPGLRVGCLVAPRSMLNRLATAVSSTVLMAPPLMAEVMRLWVEDGTAERLTIEKRAIAAERQRVARRILSDHGIEAADCHPNCMHLWIPLPDQWHGEEFVKEARNQGVAVSAAWTFAVGRIGIDAIRISLGAPSSLASVERGVHIVADLMQQSPETTGATMF